VSVDRGYRNWSPALWYPPGLHLKEVRFKNCYFAETGTGLFGSTGKSLFGTSTTVAPSSGTTSLFGAGISPFGTTSTAQQATMQQVSAVRNTGFALLLENLEKPWN